MSDQLPSALTPAVRRAMARVVTHLPQTEDLQLIVLKGHLLAEEELIELIERCVPNPKALDQLRFPMLVRLAESMHEPGFEPWLWQGLRDLNNARNEMAHRLERSNFDHHVRRFVEALDGFRRSLALRAGCRSTTGSDS